MEDKRAPFPQANDFEKILALLNVSDEDVLKSDERVSACLDGMALRQSRYYVAAARYIGLVNEERRLTEYAKMLRGLDSQNQKVELIRLLLKDDIFGKIYVYEKMFDIHLEIEDVIPFIKDVYPNYTDVIYHRRAQAAIAWVDWVNQQFLDR